MRVGEHFERTASERAQMSDPFWHALGRAHLRQINAFIGEKQRTDPGWLTDQTTEFNPATLEELTQSYQDAMKHLTDEDPVQRQAAVDAITRCTYKIEEKERTDPDWLKGKDYESGPEEEYSR